MTRAECKTIMARLRLESRSLDSFLEHTRVGDRTYVKHPAFENLYVRHTRRVLGGVDRCPCLDLVNIRARNTGCGAFKRLVARLRRKYPWWALYVENVMTARFCEGLERMGFLHIEESRCFYMPPVESAQGDVQ